MEYNIQGFKFRISNNSYPEIHKYLKQKGLSDSIEKVGETCRILSGIKIGQKGIYSGIDFLMSECGLKHSGRSISNHRKYIIRKKGE